jgi:prepilin-type N-terminal cleavage/methylation domain-containing protein
MNICYRHRVERPVTGHMRLSASRTYGKGGFTLVELLMSILIIMILAGIVAGGFQMFTMRAYRITLKHDLRNFANAQSGYFASHNGYYLGAAGDYVEYGTPPTGTLAVADLAFSPSKGVRIEISSGDGKNPNGPPPFRAKASHARSHSTFEYDFISGQMTESED